MATRFDAAASVMTKNRRAKEEEAQKVLSKTFGAWVAHHVKQRYPQLNSNEVLNQLSDGILLVDLGECITGKSAEAVTKKKVNRHPQSPIHKQDNVAIALEFLQAQVNLEERFFVNLENRKQKLQD